MKKYNDKSNVVSDIIKKARIKNKLSKNELCRRLELHGVSMSSTELKRIEDCNSIVKDFELIALCEVLNIDYNELRKTIQ